ncbi:TrkA family potassium uptake protein [Methanobacterium alkalithermotolerans]|uniref:TrkA family potassium uptake protein n=1 Tax=Methanobacterium alkalithermotolerans TaxID=2731220 RepID=A0A8T8K471_9EURY|nr:TrkA family potassium uptake protein [Methanobacterium alkalithermotolerans]QUH23254.1 TrkA family potassium uptake protein [Methanobacterium alkalithermotolerans]
MYVVIIGAGGLGLNLAKLLTADGHDVTLIEKDKTTCENAALEVDSLVICGDGTDPHTLEEANIKTADVFIAATRNDEANLLSCILVREYKIPKIIVRASNPEHEEAFRKVKGIKEVIYPEHAAALDLEKLIKKGV